MDINNIQFYKANELVKNLKATVHKTGKLGFTSDAAKHLKLSTHKSANIGYNKDDAGDKNLYLFLCSGTDGEFNIVKAGDYYYISTKILMDNLKIDYIRDSVSYDILPMNQDGHQFYALKRRVKTIQEIDDEEL